MPKNVVFFLKKRSTYDKYGDTGVNGNFSGGNPFDSRFRSSGTFRFHNPFDIFREFFGDDDPFSDPFFSSSFGNDPFNRRRDDPFGRRTHDPFGDRFFSSGFGNMFPDFGDFSAGSSIQTCTIQIVLKLVTNLRQQEFRTFIQTFEKS